MICPGGTVVRLGHFFTAVLFQHPGGTLAPDAKSNLRLITAFAVGFSFLVPAHMSAEARGEECKYYEAAGAPAKEVDGKAITPLWAYEVIGADLAKQAVRTDASARVVAVGLLDDDVSLSRMAAPFSARFQNDQIRGKYSYIDQPKQELHGTAAANVTMGQGSIGAAAKAELDLLAPSGYGAEHDLLASDLDWKSHPPKLTNISSDTDGSDFALPFISDISRRTILVHSSGNKYISGIPNPWPLLERNQSRMNAISVGAISYDGLVASFSSEGPEVVVLAPGDSITYTDGSGIFRDFGGTSGAAPLVTGSLANTLSVLGDLTTDQAKILLRNTAIPTVATSQNPRRNGAGIVNAYKLVEVARRLRASGWSKASPLRKQVLLNAHAMLAPPRT